MLGAGETRKINMTLLSWDVSPSMQRRMGSVTVTRDVNRDVDSRFGLERTIGPVATKCKTAPTRYSWRNGPSEGRDQPKVSWWPSSGDLVQSSFLSKS